MSHQEAAIVYTCTNEKGFQCFILFSL